MSGNFDHNIYQSGRMFLTRFSHKPHGAKPNMVSTFLRTGVATFAIPVYATDRDGVCRRDVPCPGRKYIKVIICTDKDLRKAK